MRADSFRFHDFPYSGYSPRAMPHMIIAIDGPSASGKGTLARKLAKRLGYAYLDTGTLYRSVGKAVLDAGKDPADETAALAAAKSLIGTLRAEDLQNPALRTDVAGQAASKVGKFEGVRKALLDFQKDFAQKPQAGIGGVILDGRDIGTVICPDADVKLFVTANTEERSKRRLRELQSKGIEVGFETVFADMKERDARDSDRSAAPLKPASDAHIIDTSTMGEGEVMELALNIIRGHIVEAAAKR
jgi:cytidylate kinase